MKATSCLLVSLFIALANSGQAVAQSSAESRVDKLEETVRALERRVLTLEEQLRQRNAPLAVPSDKANWRKLQRGQSEAEVEKLLGSPSRVDAFGPITIWYYGNTSRARVDFDGRSRTVTGWYEP
jgi:outer membrane protein assembly factor BamE (lipoprotein component of BamABCDE complex)